MSEATSNEYNRCSSCNHILFTKAQVCWFCHKPLQLKEKKNVLALHEGSCATDRSMCE